MGSSVLWPAILVICSQFFALASEELKPETEKEQAALQKFSASSAFSQYSAEEKEHAAQFFLAVMKAKAITEKFFTSDNETRKAIAEEKALSSLPARGPFTVLQTLVLDPDLQQLSAGGELPAENVVKAILDCRSFKGRVLVGYGEPRDYGLFEVRIGFKDHGFRVLDAKPAPAEHVVQVLDHLRDGEALEVWDHVLADGDDARRISVPGLAERVGHAKFQVRKVSRLGPAAGGDGGEAAKFSVAAERAGEAGNEYKVFAAKMTFQDLRATIVSVEADDEGLKALEAKRAVCDFILKFCQMTPADRGKCVTGDDDRTIADAKGLALAGNLDPFQVEVLGEGKWRVHCTIESEENLNFPEQSKKGAFQIDVSKQADGSHRIQSVGVISIIKDRAGGQSRP